MTQNIGKRYLVIRVTMPSMSGEIGSSIDHITTYSQKFRILTPYKNNKKHYEVRLKQKHYLVHRLVALTFLPNPIGFPIIRHLDDSPENN